MIFGRCLSLWKDSQITNIKILPGVEMKMKKKNVHTAKRMEIHTLGAKYANPETVQ